MGNTQNSNPQFQISNPFNFQHLTHLGWDSQTGGFSVNLNLIWRKF